MVYGNTARHSPTNTLALVAQKSSTILTTSLMLTAHSTHRCTWQVQGRDKSQLAMQSAFDDILEADASGPPNPVSNSDLDAFAAEFLATARLLNSDASASSDEVLNFTAMIRQASQYSDLRRVVTSFVDTDARISLDAVQIVRLPHPFLKRDNR
jgi:hypothetical protein